MITGTGIDIIEIDRIRSAIERWGNHFLEHVFCPEEIAYAQQHKNPYQHYAVRFAAKEAVIKALGKTGTLAWKDIQILKNNNGQPYCQIIGKRSPGKIFISLSHTHQYAVASAIIAA